jgi:hypothetical protein
MTGRTVFPLVQASTSQSFLVEHASDFGVGICITCHPRGTKHFAHKNIKLNTLKQLVMKKWNGFPRNKPHL